MAEPCLIYRSEAISKAARKTESVQCFVVAYPDFRAVFNYVGDSINVTIAKGHEIK